MARAYLTTQRCEHGGGLDENDFNRYADVLVRLNFASDISKSEEDNAMRLMANTKSRKQWWDKLGENLIN